MHEHREDVQRSSQRNATVEKRKRNQRISAPLWSEMKKIMPVFLAWALSGEVNRPKPGANVLVGVWERLIRTRSKRF